jgi:hypothetical protein
VNVDFPCVCGHVRQSDETMSRICHPHWYEANNDHKLNACRYCDCKKFIPDNLRHLEEMSKNVNP